MAEAQATLTRGLQAQQLHGAKVWKFGGTGSRASSRHGSYLRARSLPRRQDGSAPQTARGIPEGGPHTLSGTAARHTPRQQLQTLLKSSRGNSSAGHSPGKTIFFALTGSTHRRRTKAGAIVPRHLTWRTHVPPTCSAPRCGELERSPGRCPGRGRRRRRGPPRGSSSRSTSSTPSMASSRRSRSRRRTRRAS